MSAPPRAPGPGRRALLFLLLLGAGLAAYVALDLSLAGWLPRGGGLEVLADFLAGALRPALDYQATSVPAGTLPLWQKVLAAVRATVVFATAGMSLALVLGLPLGFLGSSAWWPEQGSGARHGRLLRYGLFSASRTLIALLRSVHELLWAVLFLAAVGLHPVAGVLAIALPYAGTLAKVFAEMLEEAPRDSARALRGLGAQPVQEFLHGTLPRALPDLVAYGLYRYECALRSSAVLGFFGFPTLGYHLKLSADNLHYREVWTYLYALILLVVVFELASARLRSWWVVR